MAYKQRQQQKEKERQRTVEHKMKEGGESNSDLGKYMIIVEGVFSCIMGISIPSFNTFFTYLWLTYTCM